MLEFLWAKNYSFGPMKFLLHFNILHSAHRQKVIAGLVRICFNIFCYKKINSNFKTWDRINNKPRIHVCNFQVYWCHDRRQASILLVCDIGIQNNHLTMYLGEGTDPRWEICQHHAAWAMCVFNAHLQELGSILSAKWWILEALTSFQTIDVRSNWCMSL